MNLLLSTSLIESQAVFLKSSLIILYVILITLVLSCLVFSFIMFRSQMEGSAPKILMVLLYLVTAFVLICAIMCTDQYQKLSATASSESSLLSDVPKVPTTDSSAPCDENPEDLDIKWDVMQNSTVLSSYTHPDKITFDSGANYTKLEGVTTFRGNNYRDSAASGFAQITQKTITKKWHSEVGSLNNLTGCGWTGQPLIVKWDEPTKASMNLYSEKIAKSELTEVIYPTLDGNIYFFDLDDGSYTRDPISIGMNIQGTGSLDPRGFPLMYIGSDSGSNKTPRMYIVSLIDGKIIYEKTGSDIDAYHRQFAFNTAPLIDAESDTLIWAGESGIIYFIKLNTAYNKEAGIISVKPENLVKLRYNTNLPRNVGIEGSPIINDNYLYFSDNSGVLFCVDLKNMSLAWSQNVRDRVSATPVFQKKNDSAYIYTATSSQHERGSAYIQKLDAITGEILWEYALNNVNSSDSLLGGALASPILGAPGSSIDGLIIYNISCTPSANGGTLIALDTKTGQLVWSYDLDCYSYSSPIALYTDTLTAYFVLCDASGRISLYDGSTGTCLDTIEANECIDASPAAFNNSVVVGSTNGKIYSFSLE